MLIGRCVVRIDSAHSLRRIAAVAGAASAAGGARGVRAASVRMVQLDLRDRLGTVKLLLSVVGQGPSGCLASLGIALRCSRLSCLFLGPVPTDVVDWGLRIVHLGHLLFGASKQRERHFRLWFSRMSRSGLGSGSVRSRGQEPGGARGLTWEASSLGS